MAYLPNSIKDNADDNPVFGRGDPSVLNYRLTKVIIEWLGKNPGYADFSAAVGTLECTKTELVRRALNHRWDEAIELNGDVYPPWLLPEGETTS